MNALEEHQEHLERPHGMLLRAFLSQDFDDAEPMLRVYTDDGRGNGLHVLTIPWREAKRLPTRPETVDERIKRRLAGKLEQAR